MSIPPLVPVPASVEASAGAAFRLSAGTGIDGDADAAAALAALVRPRTGLALDGDDARIALRVQRGGAKESYTLAVDAQSVVVTGADAAGLQHGVQTLGQLVARDGDGWAVPAVRIDDAPRFAYRGLMLDVARHFHPVETVKAVIDRAAGLKLNALHLHLSDDQGWRLHLDSRPLLTERASGTSISGEQGGFYTKDDYREIVRHAAARHMIVVPEIDVPGHTHAVGLAYPELVEEPVVDERMRQVLRDYGGEPPVTGEPFRGLAVGFSSLRIDDEKTYDFVADVFGELAAMTPGPYLHFGGDESLATSAEDFAVFIERVSEIVADLDKIPVAWHEAGAVANLQPDTIGQYWGFAQPTGGSDDLARAFVRNGSQLILSPADAVYLDMKPTPDAALGLTWANGPTSVERSYAWEPTEVVAGLTDDDILGVEAAMWSETIRTLAEIDAMAFPRLASAAEAAWSPPASASDHRTWASFRARVGAMGPLWTSLGIGFAASDEIPWAEGA